MWLPTSTPLGAEQQEQVLPFRPQLCGKPEWPSAGGLSFPTREMGAHTGLPTTHTSVRIK